jgi:YesN/AraC family two-component response regulator
LKKINPNVKVLLATGYAENNRVRSLLNQGIDGFIQKPFNLNELSEKMEQIIPKIIKIKL